MKLLIFALFVASVSAGSFKVGTIKCTFGPSYWCQNYKTAKECDAVKHCQDNVWKVKVSSNATCDECVAVLTFLKKEIMNPDFEKTVEGYLEQVCSSFGALADECKAIIEQYAPLIFQELANLMGDPKEDCTKLGLCAASKEKIMATILRKAMPSKLVASLKTKKRHVLKSKYPIKASAECILCEFIAKELDQMLGNNATQQEIIAALDKVCSFLPSTIRTQCTSFIDEYGPVILQILSQELNPSLICTTLGLCASKEHMSAMMKPHRLRIGNQETCEICTIVMTYLKSLLKDNATEDEIIADLEKVCNYLPAQIASECNAIVKEYGKEVLELIANADAKTLCTEIGLCTSNMKMSSMKLKSANKPLSNKCYLGASFWCANQKNAVMCNAVAFCKKHAW
ncbi:prosaposin-like [Actinia tenebrosa]|uniref:Prosaposin-like n=1 Tax=Actinia tenebrosa TaxID=6105 RepID=A0A6P8I3B0_ACTTE|nr:prosaposin-like [Actinia tenebrosa]